MLVSNAIVGYAQSIQVYNASLIDTSIKELYIGYDNHIAVNGIQENGVYQIIYNETDTVPVIKGIGIINPKSNNQGKMGFIQVFNSENSLVLQQKMQLKNMPLPEIYLGKAQKKSYRVNELVEQPQISIAVKNVNLKNYHNELYAYKLSILDRSKEIPLYDVHPQGALDTIPVEMIETQEIVYVVAENKTATTNPVFKNAYLNATVIKQLQQLPKKAKLKIHDIELMYPNNQFQTIPDQIFLLN